jgi:hypothetical protein
MRFCALALPSSTVIDCARGRLVADEMKDECFYIAHSMRTRPSVKGTMKITGLDEHLAIRRWLEVFLPTVKPAKERNQRKFVPSASGSSLAGVIAAESLARVLRLAGLPRRRSTASSPWTSGIDLDSVPRMIASQLKRLQRIRNSEHVSVLSKPPAANVIALLKGTRTLSGRAEAKLLSDDLRLIARGIRTTVEPDSPWRDMRISAISASLRLGLLRGRGKTGLRRNLICLDGQLVPFSDRPQSSSLAPGEFDAFRCLLRLAPYVPRRRLCVLPATSLRTRQSIDTYSDRRRDQILISLARRHVEAQRLFFCTSAGLGPRGAAKSLPVKFLVA